MVRNKQAAPPRVVFGDRAAVFLGNVEVQAIHMGRGHTNGDAVIYFPERISETRVVGEIEDGGNRFP